MMMPDSDYRLGYQAQLDRNTCRQLSEPSGNRWNEQMEKHCRWEPLALVTQGLMIAHFVRNVSTRSFYEQCHSQILSSWLRWYHGTSMRIGEIAAIPEDIIWITHILTSISSTTRSVRSRTKANQAGSIHANPCLTHPS